ncbi:MAG: alpha/beta fold hydrolase [Actinomycetota bacterium]|nr:alpha/beta fold hydrolase [Actinomycetota bacterium]
MRSGTVAANGIDIRYRVDGTDGPWVTFSNSLLTDLSIWDDQATALSTRYRVLRYDHRGHGGTASTDGAYSFDQLAEDAHALLDALDIAETHFVGISMGGNTGAVLAHRWPDRISSLAMCDCQPRSTAASGAAWEERRQIARSFGLDTIVDSAMERWFEADFLASDPGREPRLRSMMQTTSIAGYVGCVSVLADYDVSEVIESLQLPLLLLAGERDGTTPQVLANLAEQVPQARFRSIPDAGHISCVDGADAFTRALTTFLDSQLPFNTVGDR